MFFRQPLLVVNLPPCICTIATRSLDWTGLRVLMAMQVRSIWYDYWSQCDPAFGAELKVQVEESLKKM